MKNWLKIDHINGRLIMDRTFAKNAENTRSEEYRHLQSVRQDYPTYIVIRKQIKKAPQKENYRGLTYEFMETYVKNHEPEDTREAVSNELKHMIEISKCHSIRYPTIKKWFLAKYPEVAGFGAKEDTKSEEVAPDNVVEMPQNNTQEEIDTEKTA